MRELFTFAVREDFSQFLETVMKNPAVQGVTVDVDRTWLQLARAKNQMPPTQFERWAAFYQLEWAVLRTPLHSSWEFERALQGLPLGPLDWKWLPEWWPDYCEFLGRPKTSDPIVVRVCMLPWNKEQEPVSTEGQSFPVVIERRPQARLCSTKTKTSPLLGGLSVGVRKLCSGTLGGIVEDNKGTRFGLTCAHVASKGDDVDQPAQDDDKSARKIGAILADSGLIVSTASTPCHPKNPGSKLNQIDAALIELDTSTSADLKIMTLGKLNRILPEVDLNPGDSLHFVGKESGPHRRELVVGGLTVVFRFSDDGVNFYSFENTFQVEWPSTVTKPAGDPVSQGDSGAWLCKPDGHLYAWAGMAIGCHRDIGYALFSERVADWIDKQLANSPVKVGYRAQQ